MAGRQVNQALFIFLNELAMVRLKTAWAVNEPVCVRLSVASTVNDCIVHDGPETILTMMLSI